MACGPLESWHCPCLTAIDRPRCLTRGIAKLKGRERNGFVELPAPPPGPQHGDGVLIKRGPFADRLALYDGQAPHERVAGCCLGSGRSGGLKCRKAASLQLRLVTAACRTRV